MRQADEPPPGTRGDVMVTLKNNHLEASFATLGAELIRLRDIQGRDYLWDGDPTWWKGRAPLLFPIVGRVPHDHIIVDGVRYPMRQHGLARISEFELLSATGSQCVFRLASSPETRKHYPFDFELVMTYGLEGPKLSLGAEVTNSGTRPLPAAFGFHPAFRWPLPGMPDKTGHRIRFEQPEPAPIRCLNEGLVRPEGLPSPLQGRDLALYEALFAEDALIFEVLASRSVVYEGARAALRIEFPLMPNLGIWSKQGAGFVCIEPWHGTAAPEGFEGELVQKPGMIDLAPGASASFGMSVTLEPR